LQPDGRAGSTELGNRDVRKSSSFDAPELCM
jgi:hypothetical protein